MADLAAEEHSLKGGNHHHHGIAGHIVATERSSRDGDFDFNSGLQADTRNLLDNLAGGVQINETLVNLELITIPSLGTLTTGCLTGGDFEDFRGETDRPFHAELLILCTVDKVSREFLKVLDIAASERDTNLVDLGLRNGCTSGIILFFTLSDVTHPDVPWRVRW